VRIPGGGLSFFSNTSTVTLANDGVFSFQNLVPLVVQNTSGSLGTIRDNSGTANNFVMVAPAINTSWTAANGGTIAAGGTSVTDIVVGGNLAIYTSQVNAMNNNGSGNAANVTLRAG